MENIDIIELIPIKFLKCINKKLLKLNSSKQKLPSNTSMKSSTKKEIIWLNNIVYKYFNMKYPMIILNTSN